jgi:hypothetical protein
MKVWNWIKTSSVLPLVMFGAFSIGIGFEMGSAQEDEILWNCYLKGNHSCGNVQPTTGFVNLEFWN